MGGDSVRPLEPVPGLRVEWPDPLLQQFMALSAGSRLGHYDVTALLGEGGMGQVWQATDTKFDRAGIASAILMVTAGLLQLTASEGPLGPCAAESYLGACDTLCPPPTR